MVVEGVQPRGRLTYLTHCLHQLLDAEPGQQRAVQLPRRAVETTQVLDLGGDQERVHRLGDLDERDHAVQQDERQVVLGGHTVQLGRCPGEGSAQLQDERGHALPGQGPHVCAHCLGRNPDQPEAGGQQHLPALEQRGDLVDLRSVDPAHDSPVEVVPDDHLRAGALHQRQVEEALDGERHATKDDGSGATQIDVLTSFYVTEMSLCPLL